MPSNLREAIEEIYSSLNALDIEVRNVQQTISNPGLGEPALDSSSGRPEPSVTRQALLNWVERIGYQAAVVTLPNGQIVAGAVFPGPTPTP